MFRFKFNFRQVIFNLTLVNGGWGISYEIALRWMPLDLTDDKSTLVYVMAWCRQATNHYLSQCWPRYMSPNGVTRPQCFNSLHSLNNELINIELTMCGPNFVESHGISTFNVKGNISDSCCGVSYCSNRPDSVGIHSVLNVHWDSSGKMSEFSLAEITDQALELHHSSVWANGRLGNQISRVSEWVSGWVSERMGEGVSERIFIVCVAADIASLPVVGANNCTPI